jgi:hypothetical protein
MAPRKATPQRRRGRALAFAALAAGIIALAAIAPFADAGSTKPKVIGKTKQTPRPLCPARPPENKPNPGTKFPCSVVGSVTGFQLKGDGEHHLMRARQSGTIVAWAVSLSKPNKIERKAFGAKDFFGTKKLGSSATARIAVLTPKKKGKYKLLRQSPTVKLDQAFGEYHYITLDKPLKIKKGQIVGLTVPTWLPALGHPAGNDNSWRASTGRKKCVRGSDAQRRARAIAARPQTKIGSSRSYGCIYTDRLLYWAYYVPS